MQTWVASYNDTNFHRIYYWCFIRQTQTYKCLYIPWFSHNLVKWTTRTLKIYFKYAFLQFSILQSVQHRNTPFEVTCFPVLECHFWEWGTDQRISLKLLWAHDRSYRLHSGTLSISLLAVGLVLDSRLSRLIFTRTQKHWIWASNNVSNLQEFCLSFFFLVS